MQTFLCVGESGLLDVVVSNVLCTRTNDAIFSASLAFLTVFLEEDVGARLMEKCKDFPKGKKKRNPVKNKTPSTVHLPDGTFQSRERNKFSLKHVLERH